MGRVVCHETYVLQVCGTLITGISYFNIYLSTTHPVLLTFAKHMDFKLGE